MTSKGSVTIQKYTGNENSNVIDAREFQSVYKRQQSNNNNNKNKYKDVNFYSR